MAEEINNTEETIENMPLEQNNQEQNNQAEQSPVNPEPTPSPEPKILSDSEKMDLVLKEMKALKTEVFINRILLAVALIIAMVYAHFQASHFGEILGTLLEMFLSA